MKKIKSKLFVLVPTVVALFIGINSSFVRTSVETRADGGPVCTLTETGYLDNQLTKYVYNYNSVSDLEIALSSGKQGTFTDFFGITLDIYLDMSLSQIDYPGNHGRLEINLNQHKLTVTKSRSYAIQHINFNNGVIDFNDVSYSNNIFNLSQVSNAYSPSGLELENVTLQNINAGRLFNIQDVGSNGGEYWNVNHLTIENGSFTDYGGAFWINKNKALPEINFVDCNFINLFSTKDGGVFYIKSMTGTKDKGATINFNECNFVDCRTNGKGGAIYVYEMNGSSSLNAKIGLNKTNLVSCTAQNRGGAIFIDDEYIYVGCENLSSYSDKSLFSGCVSKVYGGAIYDDNGDNTFENLIFTGNTAKDNEWGGGAIFVNDDYSAFKKCEFYANNGAGYGGAISYDGNNFTVINSIFAGNISNKGKEIYIGSDNHGKLIDETTIYGYNKSRSIQGGSFKTTGDNNNFLNSPMIFSNFSNYNADGELIKGNSHENPILIDTFKDLTVLAANVQIDHDTFGSKYYKLTNSVYGVITPIRNFNGEFDFNNCVITTRIYDNLFADNECTLINPSIKNILEKSDYYTKTKVRYIDLTSGVKEYKTAEAIVIKNNSNISMLEEGTYYISGVVNISNRIFIKDNVNIIFGKGAVLNANNGIQLEEKNSLSLFSVDENDKGILNAKCAEQIGAGIGGNIVTDGSSSTKIYSSSSELGYHVSFTHYLGIAGGSMGTLTISGVDVNATGNGGAGIGGAKGALPQFDYKISEVFGYECMTNFYLTHAGVGGNGGTLKVYDSTINAVGNGGRDIGGGDGGDSASIRVKTLDRTSFKSLIVGVYRFPAGGGNGTSIETHESIINAKTSGIGGGNGGNFVATHTEDHRESYNCFPEQLDHNHGGNGGSINILSGQILSKTICGGKGVIAYYGAPAGEDGEATEFINTQFSVKIGNNFDTLLSGALYSETLRNSFKNRCVVLSNVFNSCIHSDDNDDGVCDKCKSIMECLVNLHSSVERHYVAQIGTNIMNSIRLVLINQDELIECYYSDGSKIGEDDVFTKDFVGINEFYTLTKKIGTEGIFYFNSIDGCYYEDLEKQVKAVNVTMHTMTNTNVICKVGQNIFDTLRKYYKDEKGTLVKVGLDDGTILDHSSVFTVDMAGDLDIYSIIEFTEEIQHKRQYYYNTYYERYYETIDCDVEITDFKEWYLKAFEKIDYIYCSTPFNLGIPESLELSIEIEFSQFEYSSEPLVGSLWDHMWVFASKSSNNCYFFAGNAVYNCRIYGEPLNLYETYKATFGYRNNKYLLKIEKDGQVLSEEYTKAGVSLKDTSPIFLYGCPMAIHSCKIYKGDTLIADLIPIRDKEDPTLLYLFDKVTFKLYSSSDFSYTEVEPTTYGSSIAYYCPSNGKYYYDRYAHSEIDPVAITFTGDYQGNYYGDKRDFKLPICEEGHYYLYSIDGEPWDGKTFPSSEFTVNVIKKDCQSNYTQVEYGKTNVPISIDVNEGKYLTFEAEMALFEYTGEKTIAAKDGYLWRFFNYVNGSIFDIGNIRLGNEADSKLNLDEKYDVSFGYKNDSGVDKVFLLIKQNGDEVYYTEKEVDLSKINVGESDIELFMSDMALHGCKVYDNEVLIRDLIPVEFEGLDGIYLYDKVNDVAYLDTKLEYKETELVDLGDPYGWVYLCLEDGKYYNDIYCTDRVVTGTLNITFTGDYEGSYIGSKDNFVLPQSQKEGFYYVFTVNGKKWDGKTFDQDVFTVNVKEVKKYDELAPECEEGGHLEYFENNQEFYADELCVNKIDNLSAWLSDGGDGYISPTGHNYVITYTWNENECTATAICSHDVSHTQTEQATAIYVKDTDATDTTHEFGHYEVVFENNLFGKQETAPNSVEVSKTQIEKPTADTTSFTYNGQSQTYEINENEFYVVTNNVQTNAGTYEVKVIIKDKTKYEWADGSTDDLTFTFTINKATIYPSLITFEDKTYVYDGEEKCLEIAEKLPEGITVSYTENTLTDVGSIEVIASFDVDENNINPIESKTATLTITKATGIINVDTTTITATYGDEITLPTATSNFGVVTCDTDESDLVNAGTYTVTYTLEGTDNYSGDTKTLTVVINKVQVTKPTADTTTYTYNGKTQTYVIEENESYSVTNNVQTDAGTYEVNVTINDKTNYEWTDGSSEDLTFIFTINKATGIINVDTTTITATYGDEITLPTATSNFGVVTCDTDESDLVNAGTYTVTYTLEGTDNYSGDTKTLTVVINKVQVTKPTADTTTYTYNGEPQTYKIPTSDYYTISGNTTQKEPGTYEITVSLNDKANFEWNDGTITDLTFTFVINEKPAEINIGAIVGIIAGSIVALGAISAGVICFSHKKKKAIK